MLNRKFLIAAVASAALLTPGVAQAQPGIDPPELPMEPKEPTGVQLIPGCENDDQPDIRSAASQIAPPPGGEWEFSFASNYNHCRDLSYATVTADINDAGALDQLLLFHHGEFIGTGTIEQVPFQNVVSSTDDSVTVAYGQETHPGTVSSGTVVTYRWDGDHVVMEGELPPR